MPYMLEDLVIDRVDLVDEGANSAAFIELYKRKENSKMELEEILSKLKPEHSEVIKAAMQKTSDELASVTAERDEATSALAKANDDLQATSDELAKANEELDTLKSKEGACKTCGTKVDKDGKCPKCSKASGVAGVDETETLKSMPTEARELFEKMKAQKDAAEEALRKAKDAEVTAKAVAKAAELKAIPYEQEKLVDIVKSASPEVLDLLTVVSAAIEGTVLSEVGKSSSNNVGTDAWSKIEAKAEEVAKRDSVSKAKAISVAIKENPDLYKEYLEGGAN